MASTLDTPASFPQGKDAPPGTVVAVVAAEELQAAKRDTRVGSFLDEADAYLIALEQQARNR
jgi:hypothetical protein